MNAMILAAGYGKRLAPITDQMPKALVFLMGSPMIFHLLNKLRASGFTQIVVNAHHHADMLSDYIDHYNRLYQCRVRVARESRLLDTGGGIKNMLTLFDNDEDVLVHNVDILSEVDLAGLYREHVQSGATASLAIMKRNTSRPLLFGPDLKLCGRKDPHSGNYRLVSRPSGRVTGLAFSGIQVIKPELFLNYIPDRFYSIDVYMKCAARGDTVKGISINGTYWKDLGTMQDIVDAESEYPAPDALLF